jgi:hypothetical protein
MIVLPNKAVDALRDETYFLCQAAATSEIQY